MGRINYILYAVLDFIVDNYKPVLETIHAEVEAIEDRVLSAELVQEQVERLYMLRRDLLRLRNSVVPLVEVCRKLEHTEVIAIDPACGRCSETSLTTSGACRRRSMRSGRFWPLPSKRVSVDHGRTAP
jgi:Mg2+ and Co2+ transporter CorA